MKKVFIIIFSATINPIIWAQTKGTPPNTSSSFSFNDHHFLMAILLVFLLIPLFATGNLFLSLVKNKFQNQIGRDLKNKISSFLLMPIGATSTEIVSNQLIDWNNLDWGMWIMLFVALIEIGLIAFFSIQISKLLYLSTKKTIDLNPHPESAFGKFWNKINNFRPIKDEHTLDTGHNYDGIRELNNVTPPWFTYSFIASILFAAVYMYRYHWAHSAPLQLEELRTEMNIALKEKAEIAASAENSINENNITLLGDADQQEGQIIFETKCSVCHEKNTASKPGGVGPNLADAYWLHGGKLGDIFYSIKNGWPEKGMISWADQLSPKEIAQVSSFIKAQQGKNITGGKEAQGDFFKEVIATATTETKIDSTKK